MKIQFKHWKSIHSYAGLVVGIVLLVIGVTGFFMIDSERFGFKDKPVTFAPLLAWYQELPEERKECKEREVLVLFTADGNPIEIASDHGALLVAETESRWVKANESALNLKVMKKKFAKTEINPVKNLHWGKIIDDLHTGKFFGGWLNVLYYGTAISLVGLTLSGVYLWYKPWAQKRKRVLNATKAKVKTKPSSTDSALEMEPSKTASKF